MKRHKQHSRQIRCGSANKVMDLLKQLALCTFLLGVWAALILAGHYSKQLPQGIEEFKEHEGKQRMLLLLLFVISRSAGTEWQPCMPSSFQGWLPSSFREPENLCSVCVIFQMQLKFRNPLKKKQNAPVAQR